MSRFKDVYMPSQIQSYPIYSSPRFSTDLVVVDSGREQANQRWEHPLHRYTIPEAVRTMDGLNALRSHWLIMRGPGHMFPFRDPLDFASAPLENPATIPTISATDQQIGVGNGLQVEFQITKTYTSGAEEYERQIYLPIVSSVLVAVDGTPTGSGWSVDRQTGVITFDAAPDDGDVITCGYLFDVSVRFEADDTFDAIAASYGVGGFADITLLETRIC